MLETMSAKNVFFKDLYFRINEMISEEGKELQEFYFILQALFPNTLEQYEKLL